MAIGEVVPYFQIAAYLAAAFGIIFTSINYFNANKIKRGEWMRSLFEKFYESSYFKSVRREIEYDNITHFLALDSKGVACNQENEELLVDYLNFFELLATLIKYKHIRRKEAVDLFGYYIDSLQRNAFIKQYATQFYFKNLCTLLNEASQ
jgi:hypothetical protein